MSQNNNNVVAHSNDPEQIDLIDLMLQLWRGKWIIGAFIAIFIVIAGIYVVTAKEKWTSTAIITHPDAAQIATYSNALNILYSKTAPSILDIQGSAVGRFSSSFSALSQALENQESPEKLSIETVIKGQPYPLSVTYEDETAEAAQKQLAQYIQQVDEQTAKELAVDLKDNIKLQLDTLRDSLSNQEKVAQEQKDLRIKQITEALKFAQAAKITAPQIQQTQYVNQDSMFLLGSEALTSMIQNESTRPLVFDDNYYQTKQNLLDIQNLNVDPSTIHVYRYVMKPDLPVRKDSPKKAIALIFAVLLGGIIGTGVVLGRNALRNYKPKH